MSFRIFVVTNLCHYKYLRIASLYLPIPKGQEIWPPEAAVFATCCYKSLSIWIFVIPNSFCLPPNTQRARNIATKDSCVCKPSTSDPWFKVGRSKYLLLQIFVIPNSFCLPPNNQRARNLAARGRRICSLFVVTNFLSFEFLSFRMASIYLPIPKGQEIWPPKAAVFASLLKWHNLNCCTLRFLMYRVFMI